MTRLIDADALLEEIDKIAVNHMILSYVKGKITNAPTVQREVPDELPKLGGGIYKHENLGELYDRLQVHKYAVNHCETIAAMLSNKNAVQREGWVSVPIEPTDEMLIAGCEAGLDIKTLMDDAPFATDKAVYKAMIKTYINK